jgi:hypothetical protein
LKYEEIEKILTWLVILFGVAMAGILIYFMIRDLQAPVTVKWVYDDSGRFSGVVVT